MKTILFFLLIFLQLKAYAGCVLPLEAYKADIIIIGETHGSKNQVEYAACILTNLHNQNNNIALALEMLPQKHRLRLNDWANIYENADKLAVDIEWWKSGWPSWTIYRPLLTKAFELQIPLIATDNLEATPEDELQSLWGVDYKQTYDAWGDIINDYHQNDIEAEKLDELIKLQMSRDIHMATAIKEYKQQYPNQRILFYVGQDHARNHNSIKKLLAEYLVFTIAQNCPKLNHQFNFNTQKCNIGE